jgi:hypothetical protein
VFIVESRRRSHETIERLHPRAIILDVTSHALDPWVKFSPFYPHGDIPVPFSNGVTSMSVEGIWQGLKVFEREDVDVSKFAIRSMKGIKRSIRRCGPILGHRRGVAGSDILDYLTARRLIYLPSYLWILENRLQAEVIVLRAEGNKRDVVLLDYETNAEILDVRKPLSHAALVARYLEGHWPGIAR